MSCSPRKWGTHLRSRYIDRNNKLVIFTIRSSVMPNPNGIKFRVAASSTQGRSHSKFEEVSFSHSWDMSNQTSEKILCLFFFSFCTLCKNRYSSHMDASIWLKFGTPIGGLKAFVPVSSLGYIWSTFKKLEAILRINKVENLLRLDGKLLRRTNWNWYVARLNIRGVSFGG